MYHAVYWNASPLNWRNCLKIVVLPFERLAFVASWKLICSHAVTPRWLDDAKECIQSRWSKPRDCGCSQFCQRFRKFRSEFKWKGPFQFLLTGIFGITSGGGPHISLRIFWPKFAIPFLTNQLFALICEFGRRIWNDKSHFYWLAQFNRKMSFHLSHVFPLISDRSVWHDGSTLLFLSTGMLVASRATTFLENYLAVSAWIFIDWMPQEEALTFQFVWYSISGWKSAWHWSARKWAFHPRLLLITCSKSQRKTHQIRHFEPKIVCNKQSVLKWYYDQIFTPWYFRCIA